MEKETANKVLLAVCAIAKPGEYVIMNRSELGQNLAEGYDKKDIDKAMMQLQAEDYITVRYNDADVYCLSVMNKGFVFGEKIREREQMLAEEERRRQEAAGSIQAVNENETALVVPDSDQAEEKAVSTYVEKGVRMPWKRLFFACTGGAFFGGILAGALVYVLSKLFF